MGVKYMNVLIVSESFIVRDSLNHLFNDIFDAKNIKSVSNINELSNEELINIDFSFIDINKNNSDVLNRLSEIKNRYNSLKIMVLDGNKDRELFLKSIDYGIDGYILNISDKEEFIYMVKKVLNGKKFYDSEVLQYRVSEERVNNETVLTNREKNVLRHVCKGLSNIDIANELNVTDYTIKKHVSSILNKLKLKNRKDIIIYAKDNHLLDEII